MHPLLRLFREMASARATGFGSPQPIGWADMQAWAALTGTVLDAFEARALRLLDATWLDTWSKAQPHAAGSGKGGRR